MSLNAPLHPPPQKKRKIIVLFILRQVCLSKIRHEDFLLLLLLRLCYHGYYWTPKIAKNGPKQHKKLFFCPKGKKSLGRRPKPSAGAKSNIKFPKKKYKNSAKNLWEFCFKAV